MECGLYICVVEVLLELNQRKKMLLVEVMIGLFERMTRSCLSSCNINYLCSMVNEKFYV